MNSFQINRRRRVAASAGLPVVARIDSLMGVNLAQSTEQKSSAGR
jgi:hypothetical protein